MLTCRALFGMPLAHKPAINIKDAQRRRACGEKCESNSSRRIKRIGMSLRAQIMIIVCDRCWRWLIAKASRFTSSILVHHCAAHLAKVKIRHDWLQTQGVAVKRGEW